MTDDEKRDRRQLELKSLADLWIHQNLLMVGRIQTLLLMQGAFLGVGYTLWLKHLICLSAVPCVMVFLLTAGLWLISVGDRRDRNKYMRELSDIGFHMHTRSSRLYRAGKRGLSGSAIYMGAAFIFALLVDASAIYLFETLPSN